MDNVSCFRSEQIPKGTLWRDKIERALLKADHLILIYTEPDEDWSWCLYETISFWSLNGKGVSEKHFIYCLRPQETNLPDFIQDIQTIPIKKDSISDWVAELFKITMQDSTKDKSKVSNSIFNIVDKLNYRSIRSGNKTTPLRPYIIVTPVWPLQAPADWNNVNNDIPQQDAVVTIEDRVSASSLGFLDIPSPMKLVEFLQKIDIDADRTQRPWISELITSFEDGLRNKDLSDQHVILFRSAKGKVFRPIIDSITRSEDGLRCNSRVIFVDAFAPPPQAHRSKLQHLADGIRMATRTRVELLDKYQGDMAKEATILSKTNDPEAELVKKNGLGRCVFEILQNIVIEAQVQGYRQGQEPGILFGDPAQQSKYEQIVRDFPVFLQTFKSVLDKEDNDQQDTYKESEKMLGDLREINSKYLALVVPQFARELGLLDGPFAPSSRGDRAP
jgi:hypothetical protein